MTVDEFLRISRQKLVSCHAMTTVEAAAKLLHAHNIGALPVCEPNGRMVGIISERDIVRTIATQGGVLGSLMVGDLMRKEVISCGRQESLDEIEAKMSRNRIRHVPVVEAGRVIGMLSIRDVLAMRRRELQLETNVLRDVVVAARHR